MGTGDAVKRPIELATDGRDPWERQPAESAAQYKQFDTFLTQGPARTLAKTAEKLERSRDHIRHVAVRFQWQTRADAWDREQSRLFLAQTAADRRKLAQVYMGLGAEIIAKGRAALRQLDFGGLKPLELKGIMEVGIKLQTTATGLPDSVVAVTSGEEPAGGMFAELTGMSLADRGEFLTRALDEMQRRARGGIPHPRDQVDSDDAGGDGEA